MRRKRPPYAAAFRAQMIELVGAGRTQEELSREFEPSAQAIRNWLTVSRVSIRPIGNGSICSCAMTSGTAALSSGTNHSATSAGLTMTREEREVGLRSRFSGSALSTTEEVSNPPMRCAA